MSQTSLSPCRGVSHPGTKEPVSTLEKQDKEDSASGDRQMTLREGSRTGHVAATGRPRPCLIEDGEAQTTQMLPIWSLRRKDICGHGGNLPPSAGAWCHVSAVARVIHPKLICALGDNDKKHPCYKMGFEVVFHPGLDIWGHEKKANRKKEEALLD